MVNFLKKEKYTFDDLVEITRILRSPGGCPWDIEQTHKSTRMNFIEEAYEACEAIDNDDPVLLQEELGDVLAQVVFHAQIEAEAGTFDINDVADGVCRKFIERHPHVFGDASAGTAEEVLTAWDKLKRKEKKQKTHFEAMNSVARSLPSLMRAQKLCEKGKKAGIPQKSLSDVSEDIVRELSKKEGADVSAILRGAVKIAVLLGKNAEEELDRKNEEFISEFGKIENRARENGEELSKLLGENADKF